VTTEDDGNTLDGVSPERFVPELESQGANIVGVNCSVGPAAMLETIERMAATANVKLSAQPNAGRPREIDGRNIYLCSPEYMASYARRFINTGVRLVGGCCGTTPEHIRQIKMAVRAMAPAARPKDKPAVHTAPAPPVLIVPRPEKSRMANCLSRNAFLVSVELVPPRGFDAHELVEEARQLRIHGVDLVNIPDGPLASARMSALSASVLVQQQAGIETILHYACRDRNLLGMQSDLLGAHSMGIRNVLLVTGDPPAVGDYPDATAVFDVDSIGLTNVVARLNRGLDIGGQSIGAPTAFHIGVAVNPSAPDLEHEFRRFQYKVEAGAEFAITQPVFDVGALVAFLRRSKADIPILAAITPLESLRQAEFLANEVPGVVIPPALLERMRAAESEGRGRAEGLAIACEIAAEVRPHVQGIQISALSSSIESAIGVMKSIAA
jgi:homocysteine S-methyltransferase